MFAIVCDRSLQGFTPGRKPVSRRRCAVFAGVNPQGLNFGWRAGAKHRRPTDINVVVPRCEASPLCGRMARFGETLEARPRFCSKHRCVRPTWPPVFLLFFRLHLGCLRFTRVLLALYAAGVQCQFFVSPFAEDGWLQESQSR